MLTLVALLPMLATAPVTAIDCAAEYERLLPLSLPLSYEEFDQTEGKGFRVLAEENCPKEAADLIEAYAAANHATQSSLTWHIAQQRATQGDYAAAIEHARQTLKASEDYAENPLRWNDYVLATIAFLEHDKAALVLHRNKVAEGVDAYWGNKLNLKLLDSLIEYFDQSYAYATSHITP